jgi:hypothetical protein
MHLHDRLNLRSSDSEQSPGEAAKNVGSMREKPDERLKTAGGSVRGRDSVHSDAGPFLGRPLEKSRAAF